MDRRGTGKIGKFCPQPLSVPTDRSYYTEQSVWPGAQPYSIKSPVGAILPAGSSGPAGSMYQWHRPLACDAQVKNLCHRLKGDSMADVRFIDLSGAIHADARGMSFFPWPDRLTEPGGLLKTFHLVSVRPGQSRGHHLHPGQAEWLYPFHGAAVFTWEAAPGQVREQVITGDRTLIHIPPGIAHTITNPGPEILYLLAWREVAGPGPRDPETVPHLLKV
jgi:uncharacterized RmlC-like cupin family protein